MAVSILALRAAGLGDLLTAVPALRALSEVGRLTLATPPWLHPVARLVPGVEGVVAVQGLRPTSGVTGSFAVNLHGSGPQSHQALLSDGPSRLLAFRSPGVWDDGPHWIADEPERARWCRLLAWAGIPADHNLVRIRKPSGRPHAPGAVMLHLGASDEHRRWPAERFVQLAGELADDGRVVLTGTDADRGAAARIRASAAVRLQDDLTGRLDLTALAALVSASRLVVCADTGVAHLAAALGVPSVVVFGPACPRRWGPPPIGPHHLVRGSGPAPAASDVPVGPVLRHARELIARAA